VTRAVRFVVLALALAAASAFALSSVGGAWWTVGGVEVGPHGSHHCMGGAEYCGLGWLGDPSWERIGATAWGTGLVAMIVLVLLAGAVAAKRTPRLLGLVTMSAVLTATVAGVLFWTGFPGFVGAHLDRGFWLFAIGVFFGLAAGVTVTRQAMIVARAAAKAASLKPARAVARKTQTPVAPEVSPVPTETSAPDPAST
jgi:hypothetical protein